MRPNFTIQCSIYLSFLSLTLAGTVFGQTGAIGSNPITTQLANRDENTVVLPKNITRDWFKTAAASIEEREFSLVPAGRSGQFAAINKLQHLGYAFDGSGYDINSYNSDGSTTGGWHMRFTLAGIGRQNNMHLAALRQVTQAAGVVHYDYNRYTVTYDNRREGMEQSILIRRRPAGHRSLEVAMDLSGDLNARLDGADQLKLYAGADGQDVKLIYDKFRVWDKNGHAVPAHMRLDGPHRLVLSVDDRHAVYPVTIDPLNHTPAATFNLTNVLGTSVNELAAPVLGGFSVAGGDVNGDNASDIIIGAPLFTTISLAGGVGSIAGIAKGAVFIYYGHVAAAPDATPAQVLQPTGLVDGALFGFSVATVPNLDGDNKADVIVGAPMDSVWFPGVIVGQFDVRNAGKVYVYKGSAMGTDVNVKPAPAAALRLNLPAGNGQFLNIAPLYGFSVANAGDITNDGFGDIIIGSPGYGLGAGLADIYYGASNTSGVNTLLPKTTLTGVIATSLFGYSVAGAGNVNNDAFSDVIVGAPGNIISLLAGAAYVFHGASTGISSGVASTPAATILTSPLGTIGTLYGFSVSTAGDVNNDGRSDVIVGEPLRLTLGAASGRAYIYYGTNTASGLGSSPTASVLNSPRSGAIPLNLLYGFSVSTAGNVVSDVADDVLVGEPGSTLISNTSLLSGAFTSLGLTFTTATSVLNGAVYLYKGQNAAAGITTGQQPYWTLQNSDVLTAADLLGTNVHYAGDVNGDGAADLLVTAPAGGLDLGLNLSNQAIGVNLTLLNGLISAGNTTGTAGNAYLFLGFSNALPLTLLDFTGRPDKGNVVLNWSTSEEVNTDHFEIERSVDNSIFTSIGQVSSAHNSTAQTSYTYTDLSPNNGVNYYRLKMVDMDGQFTYSKVVTVALDNTGARLINAYPNPARGSFHLVFRNMPEGRYDLNMVNAIGQTVMAKRIQVSNAANFNEMVDLSPAMAAGSYLLRVVDQQQHVYTSRVVVQ